MNSKKKIIAWWSGGVTSAVACKMSIDMFGLENTTIIFMDTKNEHADTYRFKADCEKWYGKEIETATRLGKKFNSIQDVWYKSKSLNVASGAICSSELKRQLRIELEKTLVYDYEAFGFDIDEPKRAKAMKLNYPKAKPCFPLLFEGLSKKHCIEIIQEAGIEIPEAYKLGFHNNNCLGTGCVQGGIGYWQKMQRDFPDKFNAMAKVEHDLTDLSGEPVTMLKDQGKEGGLVFLIPHPKYPTLKHIGQMKGRPPKPLMECNGFCSLNDLNKNETELEINYAKPSIKNQTSLF